MFGKIIEEYKILKKILKKGVKKVTHPERDNCCRGIPSQFETDVEILIPIPE